MVEAAAVAAVMLMKKLLKSADLGPVKSVAAGARLSEQSTVVLGDGGMLPVDDGRREVGDWAGCSAARSSHGLISGTRRLRGMMGVSSKRLTECCRFLKLTTNSASLQNATRVTVEAMGMVRSGGEGGGGGGGQPGGDASAT